MAGSLSKNEEVMTFMTCDMPDNCCLKDALPDSFKVGNVNCNINGRVITSTGARGYYRCKEKAYKASCTLSCQSDGTSVTVKVRSEHSCVTGRSESLVVTTAHDEMEAMVKTLAVDFPGRAAPSIAMEVYNYFEERYRGSVTYVLPLKTST